MTPFETLADLALTAGERGALDKLVCSVPHDAAVKKAVGTVRRAGGLCLQIEVFHADGKATHRNLPLSPDGAGALAAFLQGFARVNLLTAAGTAELRVGKKGVAVLLGGDALAKKLQNAPVAENTAGNDRQKQYILSGSEPFLVRLGVSDKTGRVHDKKGPKFRQINRFLELIRDVLPELPKDEITIADLCCGKSYLSFAVYHYFVNVLGYRVRMVGVDLKPDVIAYCQAVAKDCGFEGLTFEWGDVSRYVPEDKPQLVISLHACDTATDVVLEKAVEWGAKVILSTPCCQHELNNKLNCPTLDFIGAYSMLRQKFCAAATDALRLKRLEAAGYRVAALELIDPEDTPKNVMLRAVLPDAPDAAKTAAAKAAYEAAYRFLTGGDG